MAEIKVTVDGKEYAQEQFKKDLVRMFDTYRHDSDHMGESNCNGVDCRECPLGDNSQIAVCEAPKTKAFDLIEFVQKWAQEQPIVTNKDKLKELFGIWIVPTIVIGSENKDEDENHLNFEFLFMKNEDHTVLAQFKEKNDTFWKWLNEEYKEHKGEKKNG